MISVIEEYFIMNKDCVLIVTNLTENPLSYNCNLGTGSLPSKHVFHPFFGGRSLLVEILVDP